VNWMKSLFVIANAKVLFDTSPLRKRVLEGLDAPNPFPFRLPIAVVVTRGLFTEVRDADAIE